MNVTLKDQYLKLKSEMQIWFNWILLKDILQWHIITTYHPIFGLMLITALMDKRFKVYIKEQDEGVVTLLFTYATSIGDKELDKITIPTNELLILLDDWYSKNGPQ